MIATGRTFAERGSTVSAVVHAGRAAEFAAEHDHGAFEHSPLVQILEQSVNGVIDAGQATIHAGEQIPMVVPAAEVDRDESCPGFHQSPRQEGALSPGVTSVRVADFWGLHG